MSSPVMQMPTPRQLIAGVHTWRKENKVSYRKFAKISKTALSTLIKLTQNPEAMQMKTMQKYIHAMQRYKPTGASRRAKSPVSRASRRG